MTFTLLSDDDLYLFNQGEHFQLYDKLGAHVTEADGQKGTFFAVWAPNAEKVSVVGDFNSWNGLKNPLTPRASSGIWHGFIPGEHHGQNYKYRIWPRDAELSMDKADPFGFLHEEPPKTSSIVWNLDRYSWGDKEWMESRRSRHARTAPQSIYEVHLGSWMRSNGRHGDPLNYRELADKLANYVGDLGFTHVELLPVMEHPFYGSWGYQVTGYFAPTSRYGNPQDFMYFVDRLHQRGVGVILDWVPAHFPNDEHSLGNFDGTHLYEHADPRKGFHPDWKSLIFNYGRHEVRAFLISSARFWLDRYHADGLRVDGVASMLYLDYSRADGEWIPNEDGSNENRDAVSLLRRFNEEVYGSFPDIQTTAEESTAWPSVSRPTDAGGLGFGYKWDMGWMHDTLAYMQHDPVHRKHHHNKLTFRGLYLYTENYVLSISHDEVVHGKRSMLSKMPGDHWQKLANLRLLYGYMFSQPGKKLLFMGSEFGCHNEWYHEEALDWPLLEVGEHQALRDWMRELNRLYRGIPALHQGDVEVGGFEWVHADDAENSALSYLRWGDDEQDPVLVVCNFTPVPRSDYRVGVPYAGAWREIATSDASQWGGSGQWMNDVVASEAESFHGRDHSVVLDLAPLACMLFRREPGS